MTRPRSRWPRLFDSPLVVAALAAAGMVAGGLREVGAVLHRANRLEHSTDRALAVLAVDTVAARLAPDGGAAATVDVGGVAVAIRRDDAALRLQATTPLGAVHTFQCALLPGASPAAFGRASGRDVPVPDPVALAKGVRAGDHPCFRRDPGIALRHLECGTDLEDFALVEGPSTLDLGAARTIVVPGHLWIPPGGAALRLTCERDVTIVVEGNVYIGRSLELAGPGRLCIVAAAVDSGMPFADCDGNGRWSPGDAKARPGPFRGASEGVGSVYLGLPRGAVPLTLDCGLVVAGALHAFAPMVVEGPLAVAGDPVLLAASAKVKAVGTRLFRPERESVPGFAVAGGPRVGLPVAIDVEARDREQTLYLAAPAR